MSYSNYEQKVILNGYALSGVQSVDGGYGIAEKPVRVAGVGFIDALIDAPLEGNFSITRTMVSRDPLLEVNSIGRYKFDEYEISGAILYDNDTKGFGFNKAKVSRYSVSCTVGQLPEIQTDLTVYGELGKNVLASVDITQNTYHPEIPFDGSYVYLSNRDGGWVSDVNLKGDWDIDSLDITYAQYSSLYEYSRIFEEGDLLALGKDAFYVSSINYSDAVHKEHPPIQFTDQASMKVKVSDFTVDAISDFSFSRTFDLRPVYALPKGNSEDWDADTGPSNKNLVPVQIDVQYPIETDINFTMIADKYEIREIRDRIQSAPKSTVEIEIRDARTNEMINAYTGHNVRLIGETVNATIDGEESISLTYKGYDTLHNPVS